MSQTGDSDDAMPEKLSEGDHTEEEHDEDMELEEEDENIRFNQSC